VCRLFLRWRRERRVEMLPHFPPCYPLLFPLRTSFEVLSLPPLWKNVGFRCCFGFHKPPKNLVSAATSLFRSFVRCRIAEFHLEHFMLSDMGVIWFPRGVWRCCGFFCVHSSSSCSPLFRDRVSPLPFPTNSWPQA